MKNIFYIIFILLIFTFSCQDNDNSGIIEDGKYKTVTLSLRLPGDMHKTSSGTKSLTDADELNVNTIDVIAFINDGSGHYLYSYKSKGNNISVTGGVGTFKVTLSEYYREQIFVILANASEELDAINIGQQENINTVLPKLTAASATEWDANNNNSGVIRCIPMYSKTPQTIIDNTTTTLGSYNLIRMLARLDIQTKNSVANFQLVNACIFNRKDKGFIAFKDANWDGIKVTQADVPADVGTTKLNTILYDANNVSHDVIRSIYTFETGYSYTRKDATAIVVGGYYDYPANQSKITYYRIDIPAPSPNEYSGEILRNHLYNIEIQSVEDEGAETPENAFDGEIKVIATITDWNLAKQVVTFDDQYSLILSQASIDLKNYVEGQDIEITTTHPSGVAISTVKYDDENNTGWLNISPNGAHKWWITSNSENYQPKRSAQITITAGNMNYIIKITQKGCGYDGNAELMEVIKNTSAYYTHLYNGKCWMVENSREGEIEGANTTSHFASGIYGRGGTIVDPVPPTDTNYEHYYTWEQANRANNACPPGWRLPTQQEVNELISEITSRPALGKFWFDSNYNNNLSGYFNNTPLEWRGWNIKGYWWCKSQNSDYYYYTATTAGFNSPMATNEENWLSVRCVKN